MYVYVSLINKKNLNRGYYIIYTYKQYNIIHILFKIFNIKKHISLFYYFSCCTQYVTNK